MLKRMKRYLCAPAMTILCLSALSSGCTGPQTLMPQASSAAAQNEARKQRIFALEARAEAEQRMRRIGYPLLVANAEFCGASARNTVGMHVWSLEGFDEKWRVAAAEAFGLSSAPQVAFVASQSPANVAGIRPGDKLFELNSWPVPQGEGANEAFSQRLGKELANGAPVRLKVQRNGTAKSISVSTERACAFDLRLISSEERNAFADGQNIILTTGMMDFARSDDDIALVIAHELAHNAMGHVTAQEQNAVAGGIAGLLVDLAAAAAGVNTQGAFTDLGAQAGKRTFSVEFEQEADYVAIYLLAQAGYSIKKAPSFWRRMAIQDPSAITMRSTHPTSPERFVALERAVSEVSAKLKTGESLLPTLRPPTPPAPLDNDSNDDR